MNTRASGERCVLMSAYGAHGVGAWACRKQTLSRLIRRRCYNISKGDPDYGDWLDLRQVGAVWLRKPAEYAYASADLTAQERAYAKLETRQAIFSVLYALASTARLIHRREAPRRLGSSVEGNPNFVARMTSV